jgi:hypothetical protein
MDGFAEFAEASRARGYTIGTRSYTMWYNSPSARGDDLINIYNGMVDRTVRTDQGLCQMQSKHGQDLLYLSGELSRLVEPLNRLD